MKTFFQVILANLVTIALVVLGVILLGGGLLAALGPRGGPTVAARTVLVVNLDDLWSDRRDEVEPRELLGAIAASQALEQRVVLRDALDAVRQAATDDRVVAIVMLGDRPKASLTQLSELRRAIGDFRTTSRKPVYAFFDNPGPTAYYAGSAASAVTMSPGGALEFGGLDGTMLFLGGALEKLGIKMDVVRVGRFKSAVEQFTRTDMSPESRAQVQEYLGDQWRMMTEDIATSRSLSRERVQAIADSFPLTDADTARTLSLVDRVAHFDSVLVDLAKITGTSSDAVRATSVGTIPAEIPHVTVEGYMAAARARSGAGTGAEVALVVAEGSIVDGWNDVNQVAGDALARTLRDLRRSDDVRAVVLRVNSPGGSATASETIEREVALLARSRPVVVSMGEYAASGGYYIAAPATRIFADRSTLTGSIGIFGLVPNLSGLSQKLGVSTDTLGTAAYATQFNVLRGLTPGALAILQRQVDRGYELFLKRVSEGRKLSLDSVRTIAEGRVWSGEDAKPIGLVDEIGGLPAAIAAAARLAKLGGDYRVVEYPRVKSTRELFSDAFSPARDAPMSQLRARSGPLAGLAAPLLREFDAALSLNDPRQLYTRLPFTLSTP
ncbi:MAG: signal peptide peptidase SppA [Gemmatimonadaceae bacterium]|jgi:protease-4|nr:signal peptide peptidase SppA [Gemmatimonadaceae bacterium]